MASSSTATNSAVNTATEPIYDESLPMIDLRGLTQVELFSLSRCTATNFNPILPAINQSISNQSVGSHKQTYSSIRFAAPTTSQPPFRRRTPPLQSEPEKRENQKIISHFKQLFEVDSDSIINEDQLVEVMVDYSSDEPARIGPIEVELAIDPINAVPIKRRVSSRRKTTAAYPVPLNPRIDDELVPVRVEYPHTEPPMAEQISSTVPVTVELIH